MDKFILDLRSVKCPMNLILVKQAMQDGNFASGGKIIIEDEVAKENILRYLAVKKIEFEIKEGFILVNS